MDHLRSPFIVFTTFFKNDIIAPIVIISHGGIHGSGRTVKRGPKKGQQLRLLQTN